MDPLEERDEPSDDLVNSLTSTSRPGLLKLTARLSPVLSVHVGTTRPLDWYRTLTSGSSKSKVLFVWDPLRLHLDPRGRDVLVLDGLHRHRQHVQRSCRR